MNTLLCYLTEKYGKPTGAEYFNLSETVKEWLSQHRLEMIEKYGKYGSFVINDLLNKLE